jgi:hypothetical protein
MKFIAILLVMMSRGRFSGQMRRRRFVFVDGGPDNPPPSTRAPRGATFLLVALNGSSRPCRSCAMAPLFEIHVPYLLIRLRTWARRYLERADRTPKPRAKPTIRHTRLGSIFLLNLGRFRSPVPSSPYLPPRNRPMAEFGVLKMTSGLRYSCWFASVNERPRLPERTFNRSRPLG